MQYAHFISVRRLTRPLAPRTHFIMVDNDETGRDASKEIKIRLRQSGRYDIRSLKLRTVNLDSPRESLPYDGLESAQLTDELQLDR